MAIVIFLIKRGSQKWRASFFIKNGFRNSAEDRFSEKMSFAILAKGKFY